MDTHRLTRPRSIGRVAIAALALFALGGIQTQWAAHAAPRIPQTGTWEHQAPYPTRFAINGVDMVTPTEAWAVAYTDILHSTDGGVTWENQPRPGADNLYAVDFFDTQHGIAMGNTTLYTRNGGATWSQSSGAFGYDVEMADANLAFITDHRVAGYSRSTDGGATWTFRTMPSNITTIQCFDSLNCVAASPSGVYHSTDGGLTWSFMAGQGGTYVSTHFISHNQGWIVYGDSASRTTDGGATWQAQTLPPGSWIYDSMFTDANNGWGVGDNMVRTTNGGATWQEVPLDAESLPLWDVDFVDAQHGIAGGDSFLNTDSVLITSSDGGATWATRTQGSINDVLDMMALDRDHAWATSDYGGKTSRTTDGGRTWRISEVGNQYVVLGGIDMADTLQGWTVGYDTTYLDGLIYHTSDGGATWQQQFDGSAKLLEGVAVLDAQTAIIVGGYSGSGSIRDRTTDGGATWHSLNVPIGAFFYDVFFLDSQTGWMVGGDGDIVKTTDGGDTWVVQNNPAQYTLASVHFSDPNNGWAGGYYGTLVHTTNGGATWTLQDPQIPDYTHVLDVSATSPLRGWIAGYGGGANSRPFVKHTTDGGTTWIEHTPQVGPYDSFAALAFLDDDYGWAGGAAGIFRHTATGPQPTATPAQPTSTVVPPTATATRPAPTAGATHTPGAATPTTTPTICVLAFSDVPVGSPFYAYIRCLACRGIISGYSTAPPCATAPCFLPGNPVTRGQVSKMIANAAGFADPIPSTQQTFTDVPPSSPFWVYVERLVLHGAISGYSSSPPCLAGQAPCFLPNAPVTRGQLAKIDAQGMGYADPIPSTQQTFADVPTGNPFWVYVERAYAHSVISGYMGDGGTINPCTGVVESGGQLYFRPCNNTTRGQTSKIVANTFFPTCQTP